MVKYKYIHESYLHIILAIVVREDAEWTIDILGLLGILNILGVEHIMVITGREEVCKMPHKLQPRYD